jgi:hypothetical protein
MVGAHTKLDHRLPKTPDMAGHHLPGDFPFFMSFEKIPLLQVL